MAYKPVKTGDLMKWLQAKGLISAGRRSGTSHESWDYPADKQGLMRPVIIRPAEPMTPARIVKSNLDTLGITWSQFEKELVEFGIVKRKGGKRRK